jgi:hypothetical protein
MRTAKDWFEEELSGEPLTQDSVIECIKMVQEEVIRDVVRKCARNAEITDNGRFPIIDKQSILSVGDELIKKL